MRTRNWILMPTLNCRELTKKALESCFLQNIPVNIMVIDSSSDDGLAEYLRTVMVGCTSVPRNTGVSAVWNKGLDWIFSSKTADQSALVINSDVILRTDCYQRLLQHGGDFITGVGTTEPSQFPGGEPSTFRPHPDFSCFLIRRRCWEQVGKFDETMKIYASDMDYHIRMHRAGIVAGSIDLPFWHPRSSTLREADEEERDRILRQAETDRAVFKMKWGVGVGSEEYYKLFGQDAEAVKAADPGAVIEKTIEKAGA